MTRCLFVSDLHGSTDKYRKLLQVIETRLPAGVFLGGDLLPSYLLSQSLNEDAPSDFVREFLAEEFQYLKDRIGQDYPEVFVILGNDDLRFEEADFLEVAETGLWRYAHQREHAFGGYRVMGYSYVPPTPFPLKDWERYDVSRYVDPGAVSPEEGMRTLPVSPQEMRYATIKEDLEELAGSAETDNMIFLFHSPPYETKLDRAALDGMKVDHAPLDVHVGSIAIRRFVEDRQPLLTLHGHVHDSARLTGAWKDRLGRTHMFTAAHDGPELALVSFDLENLEDAKRELL